MQNRNDDDREVNHHGRSIEVGEAGTDEKEEKKRLEMCQRYFDFKD